MANTTAPPERQAQQPQTCITIPATGTDKKTQPTSRKRLRVRLRAPIVANIVVFIIVAVLLGVMEFGVIPTTKLGFYCKDPKISFLYKGETVTMTTLLVSAAIIPLLVISLMEVLIERSYKKVRLSSIWFYYKEYLIGVTIVLFLTEVAKIVVGEPRPHFLDTCEPDVSCREGTYIDDFKCTNTRSSWYFVLDASRSFPSGHAAASAFVAFYSSYIVQRRLPTLITGRLLKPFLIAILLTYSVFTSLTRITDRRHHWWDVCAGVALGLSGAAYTIKIVEDKVRESLKPSRTSTSTTTLLDVKNRDATSVCL